MSIKNKLKELRYDKERVEKEIFEFIDRRVAEFQVKHKIPVNDVYVFTRSIDQTLYESLTEPRYEYVSSVEIIIDEKDYILRNIE